MQEQSLKGFRDGGDQRGACSTLVNLANVLVERGDLNQAITDYEQAVAIAEKIEFKSGGASALQGTAQVFLDRDQLLQAREREEQVLRIQKELRDSAWIARSQMAIATIAIEQGKPAVTKALIRAAVPQFQQETMATDASQASALLARVLLAQSKIVDAETAAANALALAEHTSDRSTHIVLRKKAPEAVDDAKTAVVASNPMASVSAATKVKLAQSTGGVTKIRGDRFDRIRHAVSRGVGPTVAERGKSTPG